MHLWQIIAGSRPIAPQITTYHMIASEMSAKCAQLRSISSNNDHRCGSCSLYEQELTSSLTSESHAMLSTMSLNTDLSFSQVVGNIYNRIGQEYYGFYSPPVRIDRRAGRPRSQHNAELCQACVEGWYYDIWDNIEVVSSAFWLLMILSITYTGAGDVPNIAYGQYLW